MKKKIKKFSIAILLISVITLILSIFYDTAFVPTTMLMSALFLFSTCLYIKENNKVLIYLVFIMGVLLIMLSLAYTYMRFANGR